MTMAFRINHIHLKAPDPRKTAEWYEKAFAFKIVGDETRVFGDRFIRCQSEDGGMAINISGARTNERLGEGDANPHHGLEHFGFDSEHLETDIARPGKTGRRAHGGADPESAARASRSCARRTTCASSWSSVASRSPAGLADAGPSTTDPGPGPAAELRPAGDERGARARGPRPAPGRPAAAARSR